MKKAKAAQYFEQLKRISTTQTMTLAEIINVLSGGEISQQQVNSYRQYISLNQFGQFGQFSQIFQQKNWKKNQFTKVYDLLRSIKLFLNKRHDQSMTSKTTQNNKVHTVIINSTSSTSRLLQQIIQKSDLPVIQQKQEDNNYEQKWKNSKLKIIKKLLIIFDHFGKTKHKQGQSFDKNKQISQFFDLPMFMRYVKCFDFLSIFKLKKITSAFKNNATNRLWVDFDQFVNTNLYMIDFKQNLDSKQKYLRLKGLNQILSSQKMKKMLNVPTKSIVKNIISQHTGVYKQDIVDFLQQKQKQRLLKFKKSLKTQQDQNNKKLSKQRRSQSYKHIKTQQSPSIYQQLKLPRLRLKQHRLESITQSLRKINFDKQHERLKSLIDINQQEQFLTQYLNEQAKRKQKTKNNKKSYQLPPMKFT